MTTEHKIEEAVRVYLRLNDEGTAWEIDLPSIDGYALYSDYDDGPLNEDCECDDPEDCERVRRASLLLPLPNGVELFHMLGEATGARHG